MSRLSGPSVNGAYTRTHHVHPCAWRQHAAFQRSLRKLHPSTVHTQTWMLSCDHQAHACTPATVPAPTAQVGWFSPFLLACFDPVTETFQSVCRCMSGGYPQRVCGPCAQSPVYPCASRGQLWGNLQCHCATVSMCLCVNVPLCQCATVSMCHCAPCNQL